MKPVRLSEEASGEVFEAALWYRNRSAGLENEFLDEVDRIIPLIANSPRAFSRLLDVPDDLIVRRALLPRFPYAVIFMDLEEDIRVLAVAHVKRQPGYWLNRVRQD